MFEDLYIRNDSRIVLLVIDGLGGLPHPDSGLTELETAATPNLNSLARLSLCGLSLPVDYGITPGSAPGHLGLFGYDPRVFNIGRGVLEALGIDLDILPGDVAARGNFCTVDSNGLITDRRAGRIDSGQAAQLCLMLDGQQIDGVEIIVKPVKEHRLVVLFRGPELDDGISDTDPQKTGVKPYQALANNPESKHTADTVNRFLKTAEGILAKKSPANMVLLRGFSSLPDLPLLSTMFKLKPAAIASYPMYRGLAKLAGMTVLATGPELDDEIKTLEQNFGTYDYFFLHVKGADSAGEDGDFQRKVAVIEQVDSYLPRIMALDPDVLVVAGDHSTPAILKSHSWHPVPLMVYGRYCRPDSVQAFSERDCLTGGLGNIRSNRIMTLAMANALKMLKFGA